MAYRYRTVKVAGKTKSLHRQLMETHLGRPLLRTEQVHHRNGDTRDNRLENLEVLSIKDHQHYHKQKHPETKPCQVCGLVFTPHPTKRARAKTCSRACRDLLIARTERATKARARLEAGLPQASAGRRRRAAA